MQKGENHYCMLWHEAITGWKIEDVASAFIAFLESHRDIESLIIWMDNCNKNFTLYFAILSYLNSGSTFTKSVSLKYLVKGYTYMAADEFHGVSLQVNIYDFQNFVESCQKLSASMKIKKLEPAEFPGFNNLIRTRNTRKKKSLCHTFVIF